MLMLLASALAVASCQDPLVDSAERESLALSVVQQQTGLRLTYLCGNRFRIRTTRRDTVRVRWDVFRTADTGSVLVPGIEGAMTQRDVVFETTVRGTTRIFLGAQLVDTKANGGLACSPSLAAPRHRALPSDSALLITDSTTNPPRVYYRNFVHLLFREEASDSEINAFLQRFGASIFRSTSNPRAFVVELPDLGPSMQRLRERYESIRRDPAVRAAMLAEVTPPDISTFAGRFPDDAIPRREWLGAPGIKSWALRAVRANLAWACETGLYGSDNDASALGILEARTPIMNIDLAHSVRRIATPLATVPFVSFDPNEALHRAHATEVAGVAAAEGDNGSGGVGVVWRANVRMAAIRNSVGNVADYSEYYNEILPELAGGRGRVVNLSTHMDYAGDSSQAEDALGFYESVVRRHPNTLFVVSTGQAPLGQPGRTFGNVPSHADVRRTSSGAFGNVLLFHFTRLKQLGYRNIIVVGGAELDGSAADAVPRVRRYYEGDWVSTSTGAGVDIVAPAKQVYTVSPVVGNTPGAVAVDGTSFAAPMVAGAAVAALSIDPTLTATELRDLILQSARDSIVDGQGATRGKQPVYDGVYMLDVYNLLRRVSERSPTLPICGQTVMSDQAGGLRVVRQAGNAVLVRPSDDGNAWLRDISVGPGGRRIAVSYWPTDADVPRVAEYVLGASGWSAPMARPGFTQVNYVDGDTLLFNTHSYDPNTIAHEAPWTVERRGRRPLPVTEILGDLRRRYPAFDRGMPVAAIDELHVLPDPTGRSLYARTLIRSLLSNVQEPPSILSLEDGRAQELRESFELDGFTAAPTGASAFAWSPTGDAGWHFRTEAAAFGDFWIGHPDFEQPVRTRITRYKRIGTDWRAQGEKAPIRRAYVSRATTSRDGGRIAIEEVAGVCRTRVVRFDEPTQQLGEPTPSPGAGPYLYNCERRINLRFAGRRDAGVNARIGQWRASGRP